MLPVSRGAFSSLAMCTCSYQSGAAVFTLQTLTGYPQLPPGCSSPQLKTHLLTTIFIPTVDPSDIKAAGWSEHMREDGWMEG